MVLLLQQIKRLRRTNKIRSSPTKTAKTSLTKFPNKNRNLQLTNRKIHKYKVDLQIKIQT